MTGGRSWGILWSSWRPLWIRRATMARCTGPGAARRSQYEVPELGGFFQQLHRRRVKGDSVKALPDYPSVTGRKDQYVNDYFGREYKPVGPLGPAREVFTRAARTLFHDLAPPKQVSAVQLARDDPETLDLMLGVLLHYDPAS